VLTLPRARRGRREGKDKAMAKYRKKPVVIEAFQLPRDRNPTVEDLPAWFMDALFDGKARALGTAMPQSVEILTLEGNHIASPGDFIIQGIKGELYPCKPDIFAATYEPAE
jgi:hypothetical protein